MGGCTRKAEPLFVRPARAHASSTFDASVGSGTAVDLGGRGSTLPESTASAGLSGTGVRAGDDTIVRATHISGRTVALRVSSRTVLTNNEIHCVGTRDDPCIDVEGADNLFSSNRINEVDSGAPDGLVIRGNSNHAMDNVFIPTCDSPPRSNSEPSSLKVKRIPFATISYLAVEGPQGGRPA